MTVEAVPSDGVRAGETARFGHAVALLSAAILAVSVWHVFTGGMHQDVSWLLTAAERLSGGERLYVDIGETNPPFSVYLYVPMVWLGSVTPVSAETWTNVLTFAWVLSFGSFALSMTRRLGLTARFDRLILLPAGIYLLVLFVPNTFSQREHFALAAALPMLVLAAWRMTGGTGGAPRLHWILLAGLGATVTMMVKPHYALAFLFPYLLAAWTARSLRVLFAPEVLLAGFMVIACLAAIRIFHPEYVADVLPLLLDVYTTRETLFTLIVLANWIQIAFAAVLAVLIVVSPAASKTESPLAWSFAAGALGFCLAFLILGKGWNYHAMPGLVLTLAAIALIGARWAAAALRDHGSLPVDTVFIACLVTVSVAVAYTNLSWRLPDPSRSVAARVNAVVARPKVASVSHAVGVGFPWTRRLHGTWFERESADWIVATAVETLEDNPDLPAGRVERIEMAIGEAVAEKIAAWEQTPPDVVLLDVHPRQGMKRITENPELARLLAEYRVVYEDELARLALRADLLPAWEAENVTASSPGAASD